MRLFTLLEILGFCIGLLLQMCRVVSCANHWAGSAIKLKDFGSPVGSYCENINTNTNGLSSLECLQTGRIEPETGLEFFGDVLDLNLDSDFYFGHDPQYVERRNQYQSLELVQMFISNIKQLPIPVELPEGAIPIGSGKNLNMKPAWCFHPFLLKDLVKVELRIYKILRQLYTKQGTEFAALKSYLLDIEESSIRAILIVEASNGGSSSYEDPYLYVASHPTLIYRLVRRFAVDLQPILTLIESQPYGDEVIATLYEDGNPDLLVFPTPTDLEAALDSFRRIQHGSDLNVSEIARGIFGNIDTGIHFSALHCLEAGAYYLKHWEFDYAVQWFHYALNAVQGSSIKRYPEIEVFFKLMLQMSIEQHNKNFENRFNNLWGHGVFNSIIRIRFEPTSYERRRHQLYAQASQDKNITVWNWAIKANFKRVCSGENLQTDAETAALKCWYHRWNNYYWFINPLKTELLHMNPPVFQIYDFIGENLMEKLKNLAISKLERSTVVNRDGPVKSKVDSTRTSSQTWFYADREDGEFLVPLTRRMGLMSGLTILPPSSSDAYQVASYGPSHHYEAHIDSFEDPQTSTEKSNRITTIMGYVSDVKVGGRTGFPVLGISAEPIKGSIVMWDSLKRNGETREMRSWHGGCPVVLGIKWITNKWVYYKNNVFNFQCTLDPDE